MYNEELDLFEEKLNELSKIKDKKVLFKLLSNLITAYKKVYVEYGTPVKKEKGFYATVFNVQGLKSPVLLEDKIALDFRSLIVSLSDNQLLNVPGVSEFVVELGVTVKKAIENEKKLMSDDIVSFPQITVMSMVNDDELNLIHVYRQIILAKLLFTSDVVDNELEAYIVDKLYDDIQMEVVNNNLGSDMEAFMKRKRRNIK